MLTALVLFALCILAGRFLTERAYKQLTDKQKVSLMDSFTPYRKWSMVPVIALCFAWFIMADKNYIEHKYLAPVFIGAIILLTIMNNLYIFSKMKSLDLSEGYCRQVMLAAGIKFGGLVLLMAYALITTCNF